MRTAARAALGLVVAMAAALVAIMLSSPMSHIEPEWLSEAMTSAAVGAIWMAAGISIAGRDNPVHPILFLCGAAAAWFFSRGIVHSVSQYYGLFSFATACLGAAIAWLLMLRRAERPSARLAAVIVPCVTMVLAVARPLATPTLGVTRDMRDAEAGDMIVSMLYLRATDEMYLWTRAGRPAASSRTVKLETDAGSPGMSDVHLTPVEAGEQLAAVCEQFRADTRDRIQHEIAEGFIPRFITVLPSRIRKCEGGTVWRIERHRS